MKEEWRDVVGYEGHYQVSNLGNIRSCDRVVPNRWGNGQPRKGKLMKPGSSPNGYRIIVLQKKGIVKYQTVHRTVMLAFTPNPENKSQINHKDGNKENNSVENIEWATEAENKKHAIDTGLFCAKGEKNPKAKLSESKVRCIRLSNVPVKELAGIYDVDIHTIYNIRSRRSWRHVS